MTESRTNQIIDAYTAQDYVKCISLIDLSPKNAPNSNHLLTLKASCLINMDKRCDEAFKLLFKIIKKDPNNGLAFYSMGLGHLKGGNYEQSIKCFNKATECDENNMFDKEQLERLKKEVQKMQKPDSLKPSQICNRKFSQRFSFSRHMKIHDMTSKKILRANLQIPSKKLQIYSCDLCGERFSTKSNLEAHLKVHLCQIILKRQSERKRDKKIEQFAALVQGLKSRTIQSSEKSTKNRVFGVMNSTSQIDQKLSKEVFHPSIIEKLPKSIKITKVNTISSKIFENGSESSNLPNSPQNHSTSALKKTQKSIFAPKVDDFECISLSSAEDLKNNDSNDWNLFFNSLIPDLTRMNEKQKRLFKRKTYEFIEEILE